MQVQLKCFHNNIFFLYLEHLNRMKLEQNISI